MSHNTWIHRIVRVGVRPLVRTPVMPNHITTLRLATGLGATAAYAVGGPEWSLWGGVIFVVSVLLDRADGELARLADRRSPGGHRYDLMADSICNAAIFIGIGVGLRHGLLGLWAAALGVAAGLAVAVVLMMVLRLEALDGSRAAELDSAAGFDADDAILLVPVLVWAGLADWMIVGAAVGAPAFALFMYLKFRARLNRPV
jgi:phosphatidylglycerophosphate synthase